MYESIKNYLGIIVLGTGLYFSYKYLYPSSVEESIENSQSSESQ